MLLNCNSVKRICLRITGLESYSIKLKSFTVIPSCGALILGQSVSLRLCYSTVNRFKSRPKSNRTKYRTEILNQIRFEPRYEQQSRFQNPRLSPKLNNSVFGQFELLNFLSRREIELINRTRYEDHKRKLNRIIRDHLKSYKAIQIHSFRSVQYDSKLGSSPVKIKKDQSIKRN